MRFDPDEVQSALRKSWSLATAHQWTLENPAAGQCNVTALLVHELFGGDLLKTPLLGRRAGSNKRPVSRSQRCLFSGGLSGLFSHYLFMIE